MFGPYEIEHNGRTYHGDVALVEHHIFERSGVHCLFRVQEMAAVAITPTLAGAISRLIPGCGTLIPDPLMQALRGCGLVAADAAAGAPDKVEGPGKAGGLPVITLELFLAQRCNMRCVYCYGDGGEYGDRGMMTAETALAAVDWLMEHSLDEAKVYISFFGGEPLLNFPVMQQVVAYAKQQAGARGKAVAFGITTNASLVTNKIIAYLQAENITPLVSFDGPPEVQNRQRPFRNGHGSYDRVSARIQALRKAFPNLKARATVWGDSDPMVIRQGLEAVGFTSCQLVTASPMLSQTPREVGAAQAAHERAAERMLAYQRNEVALLFTAIRGRTLEQGVQAVPKPLAGLITRRKEHFTCGVGRAMTAVSVSGDFYPCHRFVGQPSVRLGHLRDYRAGGLTDYHRAVVENLPLCRSCWARYSCGGGCFHHNQGCTGDMHRPDPLHCREVKTIAEDVIHAWCQLDAEDQAYLRERASPGNP